MKESVRRRLPVHEVRQLVREFGSGAVEQALLFVKEKDGNQDGTSSGGGMSTGPNKADSMESKSGLFYGTPVDVLVAKVLPFLERKDWNAFAMCCKEIMEASKAILPPWPQTCELKVGQISILEGATWSPDGSKVACHVGSRIYIFDRRRGLLANASWNHGNGGVSDLAYSPDGTILVSAASHEYVRLWNATSGSYEMLQEWNVRQESTARTDLTWIRSVTVSPCGQYVGVLQDEVILLKDIKNAGSTVKSMTVPGMRCLSNLLFFKDGQRVLFGGREGENDMEVIKIWQLSDGEIMSTQASEGGRISNLALSKDETMVASTNRFKRDVKLWTVNEDTRGLDLKHTFAGHDETVSAVCFTPDDKYVVVGAGSEEEDDDAGIQFWRIEDGTCTKALCSNGGVSVLSYSPDGQRLLIRDDCWIYIKSIDPELEESEEVNDIDDPYQLDYGDIIEYNRRQRFRNLRTLAPRHVN